MSLEIEHSGKALDLERRNDGDPVAFIDDDGALRTWYARYFKKRTSFFLAVVLPSLLCAIYYGFIASSQYVAETRMIVRTIGVSERVSTSEAREGRAMIGGDSLTQDSYIVANFLESPDLVRTLDATIGLKQLFSKKDIDFLSRLSSNASFEELHRYWQRQVDTYVDGPSGIIVFTIRAFSPEDSVVMLNAALAAADEMIDRISEKAKNDLVARAERDVKATQADYQQALNELQAYQNETGILDPVSMAKLGLTVIAKLTQEKLAMDIELESLKAANAGDSARVRQMERTIAALDGEIALRRNSLAGQAASGIQLSDQLTEFSRLETRRVVSQAIYEAAIRNLDTAKATALRRTTYVSVFSNAQLPEESRYPERLSAWLIFAVGLLTLWVTATLIWLSIQDHRT
ncbi:capsule polysaccharide transporter [Roseibium aquae]|uniref:Capsule polysaccharide transporter n=1 Tax=Roseibium aquae TaxID=1323746 RepID=A0A916TMV1_9HYPH|nr:hypothetical protein [Roseibium aquae]GGB61209.1 capsule polysaccharide transporter [Roseibium aquae]